MIEHRIDKALGEVVPFTAALAKDDQLTDEQVRSGVGMSFHMRNGWELALMGFVIEADKRELYLKDGFVRIEDWVSSYLGIGYMSACTFVRIASALQLLPSIKQAFASGKITYDHLKALVKVATSENEQGLLEATEGRSVADTYRVVESFMAISAQDEAEVRSERWVKTRWDRDRRMLLLFGQLPIDMGASFEKERWSVWPEDFRKIPRLLRWEPGGPTP